MLLKRHYEPDALAEWLAARDAEVEPKVAHIEVKHCGKKQNLNQGFIERAVTEGWLSIGDGKISIRTDGEPLVFDIVRAPGHYSCYDGRKLNGEADAKAHVAAQDDESPDPKHPAGYVNNLYFECVREKASG